MRKDFAMRRRRGRAGAIGTLHLVLACAGGFLTDPLITAVVGQSVTVSLDRVSPDVILSWTTVDRALAYTVEAGLEVGSLTGQVQFAGSRYAEAPASDARFYRLKAETDSVRLVSERLVVDQFGYPPGAKKVAVLNNPKIGFNATNAFTPGPAVEVRRAPGNATVFSAAPMPWQNGATHADSGDQAWWLDISAVTNAGNYYVFDPSNAAASCAFRIADNVYDEVLNQAVRTFFYQRCNFAKREPYAEPDWADPLPSHVGPQQDRDCRSATNPVAGTSLDLTGGWYDAGDYNKYVNFADKPLHDLLAAYEERPEAWGDHTCIPESGNGVPDLLDELKWELDWLLRMQRPDGSVLHKVSGITWDAASPPSHDTVTRRYAPPTASATISACGVFAHAAVVYQALSNATLQAYGDTLKSAALAAWQWLEDHPGLIPSAYDNAGFVNAAAEDTEYQQFANRVGAAVYLFALTGGTACRDFMDANYADVHLMQWHYIYSSEVQFQDALVYYARLPGATALTAAAIRDAYVDAAQKMLAHHTGGDDAYRAWIDAYYWGSNQAKGDNGNMMYFMLVCGWDPANAAGYRDAAAAYVHYLHGVNPLGLTYVSNMRRFGAERSVPEFYHSWFADGTDWDNAETSLHGPPPGYLVGGPNPGYAPDPAYTGLPIEPPQNQPALKAYRSWNTGWPENSWEITENSIYTQSAYVRLLSKFVSASQ